MRCRMLTQLFIIAVTCCMVTAERDQRQVPDCNSWPDSLKFNCRFGTSPACIPKRYVCDSVIDCQDGSDEFSDNCSIEQHQANCQSDFIDKNLKYFQCVEDKMCIDECRLCDGVCDCRDRSDEANCASIKEGCDTQATVNMCPLSSVKSQRFTICSDGSTNCKNHAYAIHLAPFLLFFAILLITLVVQMNM